MPVPVIDVEKLTAVPAHLTWFVSFDCVKSTTARLKLLDFELHDVVLYETEYRPASEALTAGIV